MADILRTKKVLLRCQCSVLCWIHIHLQSRNNLKTVEELNFSNVSMFFLATRIENETWENNCFMQHVAVVVCSFVLMLIMLLYSKAFSQLFSNDVCINYISLVVFLCDVSRPDFSWPVFRLSLLTVHPQKQDKQVKPRGLQVLLEFYGSLVPKFPIPRSRLRDINSIYEGWLLESDSSPLTPSFTSSRPPPHPLPPRTPPFCNPKHSSS